MKTILNYFRVLAVCLALAAIAPRPLAAQEPPPAGGGQVLPGGQMLPGPPVRPADLIEAKRQAPKVFMDCWMCDQDFIRTEIPFVNYVRDPKEADVHILVTTQSTGSGGLEYTLAFIGQGAFAAIRSTLVYASGTTDTDDEVRRGMVRILKMGLLPYASRTPISKMIDVNFREQVKPTDVVDKWKFWVFSMSLGGYMQNESQTKSNTVYFNLSANKVTPDIKIRTGFSGYFSKQDFVYMGQTYTGRSESGDFQGLFAKSLGEHWSVGAFLEASTSTFNNYRFRIHPAPALEYNVFPYSQSTRRQLRFLYKVGYDFIKFREETIFGKTRDSLLSESLSATLEIKEPWGTLEASLEGSHYFRESFKYNRLELSAEVSFRIWKGLTLNLDGRYERIRDQIYLPKGEGSLEDVLLRIKQLRTDYSVSLSMSLSFTFGSIYSNVVNPRFGETYSGMGMGGYGGMFF